MKEFLIIKKSEVMHNSSNYFILFYYINSCFFLGTIRGDFSIQTGRNIVHGSDSLSSAEREIAHWFKPEELCEWNSAATTWVYE